MYVNRPLKCLLQAAILYPVLWLCFDRIVLNTVNSTISLTIRAKVLFPWRFYVKITIFLTAIHYFLDGLSGNLLFLVRKLLFSWRFEPATIWPSVICASILRLINMTLLKDFQTWLVFIFKLKTEGATHQREGKKRDVHIFTFLQNLKQSWCSFNWNGRTCHARTWWNPLKYEIVKKHSQLYNIGYYFCCICFWSRH